MSMLNNSKAILTYGLNEKETKDFQATGHKVIISLMKNYK